MSEERKTALVVHQDPGALDAITRALEAAGFDVLSALSAFRAQAYLEGDRDVHVVVAQWDEDQPVGGEVYRWALKKRFDLRSHFVFLSDNVPLDFDKTVGGRCLVVSLTKLNELLQIVHAATTPLPLATGGVTLAADAPTVLVVDDEAAVLATMSEVLREYGYRVTSADSGNSAIARLTSQDYDVVLCDWDMDDGRGADVLAWAGEKRPDLVDRVIVLTGAAVDDVVKQAQGRPVFPKGQDGQLLLEQIEQIVQAVRSDEWK